MSKVTAGVEKTPRRRSCVDTKGPPPPRAWAANHPEMLELSVSTPERKTVSLDGKHIGLAKGFPP